MRKSFGLSFLIVAAAATNLFALGEARVAGTIVDGRTRKPLPEATIVVDATKGAAHSFHQEYKPVKDGSYSMIILDGTIRYDVTYSAPGYKPWVDRAVKFDLGKQNVIDVTLEPEGAAAATPAAAAAPVIDPAGAAYNEGARLANEGKVTEGIAKIEQAVTARPDMVAGFQALARLYMKQKDYPKAIDRANKALAFDDEDADMVTILFDAYSATGNAAKAAEFRAKMPANPSALFQDAAKLINAGKDSQAESLLKQALAADEKFAPAYYELGMLYVRAGKHADAKTNLSKYLELDPSGKDAGTTREMLKYLK
jgi:tetratricopeptide (TPR) repeat protein